MKCNTIFVGRISWHLKLLLLTVKASLHVMTLMYMSGLSIGGGTMYHLKWQLVPSNFKECCIRYSWKCSNYKKKVSPVNSEVLVKKILKLEIFYVVCIYFFINFYYDHKKLSYWLPQYKQYPMQPQSKIIL